MRVLDVLTADDLRAVGACEDGIRKFRAQHFPDASAVDVDAALAVATGDAREWIDKASGRRGYGYGDGYGYGYGYGDGYGDGDGYGYGYGDGDGYGYGYGDGDGDGYRYGDGDGYGYGDGDGDGDGDGNGTWRRCDVRVFAVAVGINAADALAVQALREGGAL